jgi:amidase
MAIHRVRPDPPIFSVSPKHKPVLHVFPGERVVFECLDGSGGQVPMATRSCSPIDFERALPLTGPVSVEGAEPGDVLEVKIHRVTPTGDGVTLTVPEFGLLREDFPERFSHLLEVKGDVCWFGKRVRLPVRPFPGWVGVMPTVEGSNPPPGDYGGNLDTPALIAGATLLLPVFVPGGLVAIGDCHVIQGDGEVSGWAAECAGEVEVTFGVRRERKISRPQIETLCSYITTGYAESLDKAAAIALRDMLDYLVEEHHFNRTDAYLLASVCVDLRISQVVNPLRGVLAVFPREALVVEAP